MIKTNCKYGYKCYRKNSTHLKKYSHPGSHDWNEPNICPCGGGQSCIVDRRLVGDWVLEDMILINAGLSIRKNCYEILDDIQIKVLKNTI